MMYSAQAFASATNGSSGSTSGADVEQHWLWYRSPVVDIMVIVHTAVCVSGITGNAVVIFVIARTKALWNSVIYVYILNLATADLIRLLVSIPKFVTILYLDYPYGQTACKFIPYTVSTVYMVSVYTLLLICLSRYFTIVQPGRCMRWRRRSVTLVICGILWLVMLIAHIEVLTAWTLVTYRVEAGLSSWSVSKCYVDRHIGWNRLLPWLDVIFGFLLPVGPIMGLSITTVQHLHRQQVKQYLESRQQLFRLTLMFIFVATTLLVCLFPRFVFSLVVLYCFPASGSLSKESYERWLTADLVISTFFTASSAVNPFVYNYFARDFRTAFFAMAPCQRRYRGGGGPLSPGGRGAGMAAGEDDDLSDVDHPDAVMDGGGGQMMTERHGGQMVSAERGGSLPPGVISMSPPGPEPGAEREGMLPLRTN